MLGLQACCPGDTWHQPSPPSLCAGCISSYLHQSLRPGLGRIASLVVLEPEDNQPLQQVWSHWFYEKACSSSSHQCVCWPSAMCFLSLHVAVLGLGCCYCCCCCCPIYVQTQLLLCAFKLDARAGGESRGGFSGPAACHACRGHAPSVP